MAVLEAMRAIKKNINTLPRQSQYLIPVSTKTGRADHPTPPQAGFGLCNQFAFAANDLCITERRAGAIYYRRDSQSFKHYSKLPEVAIRRFVESKPVIPQERL